jgi:polysaccharide biosynthesis/export protein
MKKILLLLTFLLLYSESNAQEQSGSQMGAPATTTVRPLGTGGGLDEMGVRRYQLGPGDVLDLRVFGQQELNGPLEVDDEGNIHVPFVDKPIPARCRTDREVGKDITTALTKLLKNPQVSVRVLERRSRPPAVVFGSVRAPQRVQMLRKVRLLELLAISGGVTEQAGGAVQVFHTEPVMCPDPEEALPAPEVKADTEPGKNPLNVPFSLYKLADLKNGLNEANPVIRPGDIVIVQESSPIYITGSVVSPQGVFLRDKLSLTRAIAMVGGLRKEAKDSAVRIYRQKQGSSEPEVITVDFGAIRKKKQPDIELQAYDVIEVAESSYFSSANIIKTLFGAAQTGASTFSTYLPMRVIY